MGKYGCEDYQKYFQSVVCFLLLVLELTTEGEDVPVGRACPSASLFLSKAPVKSKNKKSNWLCVPKSFHQPHCIAEHIVRLYQRWENKWCGAQLFRMLPSSAKLAVQVQIGRPQQRYQEGVTSKLLGAFTPSCTLLLLKTSVHTTACLTELRCLV